MALARRNQLARDISFGNITATNELVSDLVRELSITPSGSVAFPSFSAFQDDSSNGMLLPIQQIALNKALLDHNGLMINKQFQPPFMSSRNNFGMNKVKFLALF